MPRQLMNFSPQVAGLLKSADLRIIVTGGSGWLGQAALEMLDRALADGFDRRVHVFGSKGRPLGLRSGRNIAVRALQELIDLPPAPQLIFHFAYLTRDKVAVRGVSDFVAENEKISACVAASIGRCHEGGIFLPSSGAVYAADRKLDDDLERNPYGVTKLRDEERFLSLSSPQFRAVICRLFNLAGPFINKLDSYALGSILTDIGRGGPIVLRAGRPVFRSYVHVQNLIDLGAALLLGIAEPPAVPFDTAGAEVIEVGDLATRAATLLGYKTMSIKRPALDATSADFYAGDGGLMDKLLSETGIRRLCLDEQIIDTASYLSVERLPDE